MTAPVWIVVASYVPNDTVFYQLRLCIESILREVPRDDYVKLLVVDDHSTYDQAKFIDHYKDDDRIEFMLLGDPLPSYYGAKGHGEAAQGRPTSEGPGAGLHKGTLYAKEHGARYVWTLDADVLILNGSCLGEALEVIERQSNVQAVGDYAWGRPGVRDGVCFWDRRESGQEKIDLKEGKVNAICALWSLEDYDCSYENKINWGKEKPGEIHRVRFENMAQVGTRVVEGLWSMGHATAYFPFLWGSYVMHFGCGTLLFTREQSNARGVGNAIDARVRYGNKSQGDYYAGFLQLNCTTAQFHKHLSDLYRGRAFDDVSARFDKSLLVAPRVH